jgi:hypothetical protein
MTRQPGLRLLWLALAVATPMSNSTPGEGVSMNWDFSASQVAKHSKLRIQPEKSCSCDRLKQLHIATASRPI